MYTQQLLQLAISLAGLAASLAVIATIVAIPKSKRGKSKMKTFAPPRDAYDALHQIMTVEHYLCNHLLSDTPPNGSIRDGRLNAFPTEKLQHVSERFGVYFLDNTVYENKRSIQELVSDEKLKMDLITVAEKLNKILDGTPIEKLNRSSATKLFQEINHLKVSMTRYSLNLLPKQ